MEKRTIIFTFLIIVVVLVVFVNEFYNINKDLFPFINRDDTYPTAREVLNDNSYADIIKLDNYIYIRNKDWKLYTLTDPEEYHEGKEIGNIKKTTTNVLWFSNLNATKLKKGTTVYSEDRDYRKGDAPLRITIEEDGEVVFYEKVKKDEDVEDRDPDENDEEVQDYINEKVYKIDKEIEVTKANVINEQINVDVTSNYDEDIEDDADMDTIIHTAFAKGIAISNMLGQLFYMSDEYEWETLYINMDELGYVEINRQLYVGMDDKLKDAAASTKGFYTDFALEEELVRKIDWKLNVRESDVNGYIYEVLDE